MTAHHYPAAEASSHTLNGPRCACDPKVGAYSLTHNSFEGKSA